MRCGPASRAGGRSMVVRMSTWMARSPRTRSTSRTGLRRWTATSCCGRWARCSLAEVRTDGPGRRNGRASAGGADPRIAPSSREQGRGRAPGHRPRESSDAWCLRLSHERAHHRGSTPFPTTPSGGGFGVPLGARRHAPRVDPATSRPPQDGEDHRHRVHPFGCESRPGRRCAALLLRRCSRRGAGGSSQAERVGSRGAGGRHPHAAVHGYQHVAGRGPQGSTSTARSPTSCGWASELRSKNSGCPRWRRRDWTSP